MCEVGHEELQRVHCCRQCIKYDQRSSVPLAKKTDAICVFVSFVHFLCVWRNKQASKQATTTHHPPPKMENIPSRDLDPSKSQ